VRSGADSIGFLGVDDVRDFEELLTALVSDTQARCGLLVDRAGRLLARVGDTRGFDETAFATLASADFAASDQLAALLGEEEFSSLYHHGAHRSMFLADLGGTAILAVLFDNRTTLGMVRIRTRSLLDRFNSILGRIAQRGTVAHDLQFESGWAAEAESEIDRLFSE
jgi:predicted regulator of Ras-like GTPase activity (Roadblock/LC7/MglB family)